jgi:hypothetical protein
MHEPAGQGGFEPLAYRTAPEPDIWPRAAGVADATGRIDCPGTAQPSCSERELGSAV